MYFLCTRSISSSRSVSSSFSDCWALTESLQWLDGSSMLPQRSKRLPPTAGCLRPSSLPLVCVQVHVGKCWLMPALSLFNKNELLDWILLKSLFLIYGCLSSWERVFLWAVWILLLSGAPGVRSATYAGGFPGYHAAWPHHCPSQVLEVPMEAILQPHQACTVGSLIIPQSD